MTKNDDLPAPGLYRLTKDVVNIVVDKRKSSIWYQPQWKAGLLVEVFDSLVDNGVKIRVVRPLTRVTEERSTRSEQARALLAACEPYEPTTVDQLLNVSPRCLGFLHGPERILRRLHGLGKVTFAEMLAAAKSVD